MGKGEILLRLLKEVRDSKDKNTAQGICSLMEAAMRRESKTKYAAYSFQGLCPLFGEMFEAYCKSKEAESVYSGHWLYPVKHPNLAPSRAFKLASNQGGMWEGEYGENRIALLKGFIEWMENLMRSQRANCGIRGNDCSIIITDDLEEKKDE